MSKGGFKTFVRKRDGLKPEVSLSVSGVAIDDNKCLYKVIKHGNEIQLMFSFLWSSSPQGVDYWDDRHRGRVPLSSDDYLWLEELYDYHANRKT